MMRVGGFLHILRKARGMGQESLHGISIEAVLYTGEKILLCGRDTTY